MGKVQKYLFTMTPNSIFPLGKGTPCHVKQWQVQGEGAYQ